MNDDHWKFPQRESVNHLLWFQNSLSPGPSVPRPQRVLYQQVKEEIEDQLQCSNLVHSSARLSLHPSDLSIGKVPSCEAGNGF